MTVIIDVVVVVLESIFLWTWSPEQGLDAWGFRFGISRRRYCMLLFFLFVYCHPKVLRYSGMATLEISGETTAATISLTPSA